MNDIVKNPETLLVQTPTPMDMIQMALTKGADIEQLQKLMDLQERWEAKQARNAYNEAMAKFKENPPKIVKDKEVSFEKTKYSHASHNQVCVVVGAALNKVGITHAWKTEQTNDCGSVKVTCTLTHVDGHSESDTIASAPDNTGGKNKIQGIASAITYLQRYSLLSAAGLSSDEADDDGYGTDQVISAEQKEQIIALLKETDTKTTSFLEYMGAESVDAIPLLKLNKALTALNKKKKDK